MVIRMSKLLLIGLTVLVASVGSSQTREFATAKGSEQILLKDDGTCSFASNGRTERGHYNITGKRIAFNIAGRQIEGFWYGDVIRYPTGNHYKSLTLVKTRHKRR